MAEVIVKDGKESIEFFGKVDRDEKGNIRSTVPSWYLDQHKEELGNSIDYAENQLQRGLVPESEKPLHTERLRQMKKKMDDINESHPRFDDNTKDFIDKSTKGLGKKITDAMFSRSDMMKGIADAHEEARRMADPCIELNKEELMLAEKAGCRVDKGRVSRTDAERMWKFGRKALGESSNTELLRR